MSDPFADLGIIVMLVTFTITLTCAIGLGLGSVVSAINNIRDELKLLSLAMVVANSTESEGENNV